MVKTSFPFSELFSDSLYMGNLYDKDFPGDDFRRVTALNDPLGCKGYIA